MKAVRIHQFGGPEVLTYEDIPDPQLRIQVDIVVPGQPVRAV